MPDWATPSFRRSRRRAAAAVAVLGTALGFGVGGCSTISHVGQAIVGQTRILCARRPIERWLNDPATSPELRDRLKLAQDARRFAVEALALPDAGYRTYVELPREPDGNRPDAVVWNVFAAPELSLEPLTWCFPVAGCVIYRGYFARSRAESFAAELKAEGHDVAVAGAAAYSTLGWFEDPLLSTVIDDPPLELAGLIFHELAHVRFYVPGDSELNESFATAVEEEGLRRWVATGAATDEELEARQATRRRRSAYTDLLLAARSELDAVYQSGHSAGEQREGKARILDTLADHCADLLERSPTDPACRLDNADLVAVGAYHGLVPAFDALLTEVGHDLPTFYARVAELEHMAGDARRRALERPIGITTVATPTGREPAPAGMESPRHLDQSSSDTRRLVPKAGPLRWR